MNFISFLLATNSAEPEVPGQDEADLPSEASPLVEPEVPVVELKSELAAEAEAPISEPAEKAPTSPTPADPAPAMPEENRVQLAVNILFTFLLMNHLKAPHRSFHE